MKTYRVRTHVQRLADCLVANGKPFCFDGAVIEFTASSAFVERIKRADRTISLIDELNTAAQ